MGCFAGFKGTTVKYSEFQGHSYIYKSEKKKKKGDGLLKYSVFDVSINSDMTRPSET